MSKCAGIGNQSFVHALGTGNGLPVHVRETRNRSHADDLLHIVSASVPQSTWTYIATNTLSMALKFDIS